MRKVSSVVGLALLAFSGSALAQEGAPPAAAEPTMGEPAAAPAADVAPAPAEAAAPAAGSDSKMQLGVNLLPMLMGKTKTDFGDFDMKMAYGVGLHFDYVVAPGFSVGFAPQALFNVKGKDGGDAAKAYDLMVRLAYTYVVAPKIGLYAEVLPGYSIISPPSGDSAKGLVIAGGVGGMMDVTDQVFVNLGLGYQYGMEKVSGAKANLSYLRIALGAGMRL
jgi:hypothetical protein